MSKLNEININIKKALITKVNIELKDEGKVEITATVQLLTEQNKVISEVWFSNNTWMSDERKIEIPVDVHIQIGEIFRKLTPVVYQKMNDSYTQLPAVTSKKKVKTVPQEEINPDDIPF